MRLSINCDLSTAWRLPLCPAELQAALQSIWLEFGAELTGHFPEEAVLEFALLDEAEMARLNQENLGCSGPTNILAFPAAGSGPGNLPPSAGLLAMSPWTMRREAMLYQQDLTAYTLRLLAHGLAHLLGYEHGAAMDEAVGRAAHKAHGHV